MSKTHEATPRRQHAARDAGLIPRSGALIDVGSFAAILALLTTFCGEATHRLTEFMRASTHAAFTAVEPITALQQAASTALVLLSPVLLAVLVAVVAFTRLQGRFAAGSRSRRAGGSPIGERVAYAGLALLSLLFLLCGGAAMLASQLRPISRLPRTAVAEAAAGAGHALLEVFWQLIALQLLLAMAEFAWRRYAQRRALRMSRDELRREQRLFEGPVEIRNALRRRARPDDAGHGRDVPR